MNKGDTVSLCRFDPDTEQDTNAVLTRYRDPFIFIDKPEPCIMILQPVGSTPWNVGEVLWCVGPYPNFINYRRQDDSLWSCAHGSLPLHELLVHGEDHTPAEIEKLSDAQRVGFVQGRGAHSSGIDLTKLPDVASAAGKKLEINESQHRALHHCLTRYLTLVHGPPGTGKRRLPSCF